MQCPDCQENSIITDEFANQKVCELCGLVVDDYQSFQIDRRIPEGERTSGYTFARSGENRFRRPGSRSEYSVIKHRQLWDHVYKIAQHFSLTNGDIEEIKTFLTSCYSNGWRSGRPSRLVAAAGVILFSKRNKKPLTVVDLAKVVGCDVYDLGRLSNRLTEAFNSNNPLAPLHQPTVDPSVYVDRYSAKLVKDGVFACKVSQLAKRILSCATRNWLDTGRNPPSLAAAAVLLALESCEQDGKKKRGYDGVDELGLCAKTVSTRVKELKDLMMKIAEELPFIKRDQPAVLLLQIPSILKYNEFMSSKSSNSNVKSGESNTETKPPSKSGQIFLPPSFVASSKAREQRKIKIERAKKRLGSIFSTSNASQWLTPGFLNSTKSESKAPGTDTLRSPIVLASSSTSLSSSTPLSSSINITDSNSTARETKHEDGSLDEEDLLIEKLLLEGANENDLLEGNYLKAENDNDQIQPKDREESTELSEKDLPDAELYQFIRSPSEISRLKTLMTNINIISADATTTTTSTTTITTTTTATATVNHSQSKQPKQQEEEDGEDRRPEEGPPPIITASSLTRRNTPLSRQLLHLQDEENTQPGGDSPSVTASTKSSKGKRTLQHTQQTSKKKSKKCSQLLDPVDQSIV